MCKKSLWQTVNDQAKQRGLISRLPQANPKETITEKFIQYHNVAPRSQKIVSLTINDAGVMFTVSNGNADMIDKLHKDTSTKVALNKKLELTSIREWQSGHRNFSIKPTVDVKKLKSKLGEEQGRVEREVALLEALTIAVDLVQQYV